MAKIISKKKKNKKKKGRNISRNCQPLIRGNGGKTGINEVREDDGDIDVALETKDNSIYLGNEKFAAVFGSVAKSNFLSDLNVRRLGLQTHKNTRPVKLFACLDEEFECIEHVILNANYRYRDYRKKIHILPEVERDKNSIGSVYLKTVLKKLKHDCGCENNIEPDECAVEGIYRLPKKLQSGIDKAMAS